METHTTGLDRIKVNQSLTMAELARTGISRQELFSRAVEQPMTPQQQRRMLTGETINETKHHDLYSKEYTELCKSVFKEAYREAEATLEQTTEQRIKTAWRIVREMARSKRLIQTDEPLLTVEQTHKHDMWNMPTEEPEMFTTMEYLKLPDATACVMYLQLCGDSLRLKKQWWPWVDLNRNLKAATPDTHDAEEEPPDHYTHPEEYFDRPPESPEERQRVNYAADDITPEYQVKAGLPIMPPPVPINYVDEYGEVVEHYDPKFDPNIQIYVAGLKAVANHLGITSTKQGQLGLKGLLSVNTVRMAFPTRTEIVSWEYLILDETTKNLVKYGAQRTYAHLLTHHGLHHYEASGMLSMSRAFASKLMKADRAEDRAIMLMRCDSMLRTARQALDLKTQTTLMKQMAQLMGLNKPEESETLTDFVNVVKQHTDQRERLGGVQTARRAIPDSEKSLLEMSLDE